MLKKSSLLMLSAVILMFVVLTGCGQGSDSGGKAEPGASKPSNEPLTLQVYQYQANVTDDEFKRYFADPIKKKYPNITLELVRFNKDEGPDKLVAAGTFPDIIFCGNNSLLPLNQLDIPLGLNQLVKSHNVKLDSLNHDAINAIKLYSDKNELLGLPMFTNFFATFYNKDIFDKFAVSYPKDGMSWEDMLELAKKLTRSADGVQYRGLDPGNVNTLASGLGLSFVNPKTMKSTINNDGWKKVFQYYKDVFQIPGNFDNIKQYSTGRDGFVKEKNLAMLTYFGSETVGLLQELQDKGTPMNWDMVTYPSFKDHPGVIHEIDVHLLAISKGSKHPEEAFNVISYLTTNKEVQQTISQDGNVAALIDAGIRQHFGENKSVLKGKNIQALFKPKPAKFHAATNYDGIVRKELGNQIKEVIQNKVDVNTALRTAEDAANQNLAAAVTK